MHRTHRRRSPSVVLATLYAALAAAPPAGPATAPPAGADTAKALLEAGNRRFVVAATSAPRADAARRAATATGQHPIAAVVGCADSRTAPEILFDQGIGDLFVVRSAGNLVETFDLASLEYAVEHLGVRLIVVLGHERCGAVQAALASGDASGHLGELVRAIQPAVRRAREKASGGDALAAAIEINAELVAEKIRREGAFGAHAAEVRVVAGEYDLDTGEVRWTE